MFFQAIRRKLREHAQASEPTETRVRNETISRRGTKSSGTRTVSDQDSWWRQPHTLEEMTEQLALGYMRGKVDRAIKTITEGGQARGLGPGGPDSAPQGTIESHLRAKQRLMEDEFERKAQAIQMESKRVRRELELQIEELEKQMATYRLLHGEDGLG